MNRIIFILIVTLILLTSCRNKITGQEILDKLSNEMCQCIELAEYKNSSEIQPCYDKLYEKYGDLVKGYYKTNELTDFQIIQFNNKIAAKTVDNCEYIKNNFPVGIVGEKRTKQKNLNCDDLREINFFYVNQVPGSNILDTTFGSIMKNGYIEKKRRKTTFLRSKIIWKDNCEFDLIFEESNDPFFKELFQKGQLFNYTIIANEEKSFFLESKWKGEVFQRQMFKIE